MSEGFFSRWSRRKQEVSARASEAPLPPSDVQDTRPPAPADRDPVQAGTGQAPVLQDSRTPQPLPTLEDVQRLTTESDFQPFMRPGVGPEVRNAAMKKLFADPHFNVMDGLDVYIDDYSQPDPMPAGMLRQLASAQFLKLAPEPPPEQTPARLPQAPAAVDAGPTPAGEGQVVAQSPDASAHAETTIHDHPDLQLQPDPAPADPQPGSGPR